MNSKKNYRKKPKVVSEKGCGQKKATKKCSKKCAKNCLKKQTESSEPQQIETVKQTGLWNKLRSFFGRRS